MKSMTRHYPKLTADERLRLLLAAWDRGDESEEEELAGSAPVRYVEMRDYFPLLMAYKDLALICYIELLDLAASIDYAWLMADHHPALAEDDSHSKRWIRLALVHSYQFTTKLAAWLRFCEEMLFPPDLYWQEMPGCERLIQTNELAASTPVSERKFRKLIRSMRAGKGRNDPAKPLTIESATEHLHQLYEETVEHWKP